ncbi:hypothetical protein CRP01_27590 [Flavilitoribacter nigricans DSM 23189 = NBRC 102662]|uniref:Uncharacterized protein n=1 Tax=Flavilitoribacter nigricans (strain ATCC 23147 / DSM 23189 / NBRC 102662 / NCIMB 1420 / SS-2) TaxID=1122177 RepID=A0A2D0N4T6_FLAN2|nr:hypothetical protein CRP01_27590 [Flavilitoribacter nigricans DSM 23189 = NBRC 102662]
MVNRLYPLVKWITDCQNDILLLLNIYDRRPSIFTEQLIYGGLAAQLKFLSKGSTKEVDRALKEITEFDLPLGAGKVASKLYDEFIRGELGITDLQVGRLKDYFEEARREGQGSLKGEQALEYPILDHFFDIGKDRYLSFPLIQFGDFDGVVHLIFKNTDIFRFSPAGVWKQLIRIFSSEYENLLLGWELVGSNIQRKSTVRAQLEYLTSKEYEEAATTNPIFRELRYRQYYEGSYDYLLKRVDLNDIIPDQFKDEHRKRAIISILIDSYAHNISAHSLTVLKWWFQQRAFTDVEIQNLIEELKEKSSFDEWGVSLRDYLNRRFPEEYSLESIEEGILLQVAHWIKIVDKRREIGNYLPVRDQLPSLAEELHPLFKFLLEKGAFWSGITRDQQFGGEMRNMYDILWNDFIRNPLYLGTIAHSEKITKLHIQIRIYSGRRYPAESDDFIRSYELEKDEQGQVLSGTLATINVGGGENDKTIKHKYIIPGTLHDSLKAKLETFEIFLPGGVVGKHSLFTLIENEIRNVKHFQEPDLAKMRTDGLKLVIAIRPGNLSYEPHRLTNKPLYKIGVWLGHETILYNKGEHLVVKRLETLKKDIITQDTNQARLGGNFQDKICAAMLFNNSFISVERRVYERDDRYYPWLRSAFSTGVDQGELTETDFEIKNSNLERAKEELTEPAEDKQKGFFKKYFHLWRAAPLYKLESLNAIQSENVARFKIVTIPDDNWKKAVRELGVIRILPEESAGMQWEEAYQKWLNIWLKEKEVLIELVHGKTAVGYIVYDQQQAAYYNQDDYLVLDNEVQENYAYYTKTELRFAHGTNPGGAEAKLGLLAVRNHGVLVRKFFDNLETISDFDRATITPAHILELVEVIQTRICIFDKRVADRITDEKRAFLNERLNCGIYSEDEEQWETIKKAPGLSHYHFIIMHLSFLEAMKNNEGKRYGEEGIVDFIDEQIGDQLGDNCIFVVTTGRGREQWWRKLKDSKYMTHTTFRPVESLIEAVETASLKNDDLELKFNLVKTLFGS